MMTNEMVESILEATLMFDEVNPREYSGRFMYGAKCFALDGDPDQMWELLMDVAADLGEPVPAPSRDSMGLGMVYYWEGTKPPDGMPQQCEGCEGWYQKELLCSDCGGCNPTRKWGCCDCEPEEEKKGTQIHHPALSSKSDICNVCDDRPATEYATGAYGIPCCDGCLMVAEGTE
jgi:hypothetical protein